MTNNDVILSLEKFAPTSLAEDWDRVGLMLGSKTCVCKGVVLTLDLTKKVAEQAVNESCNLIVTHHPFFFNPISSIDVDEARGELIDYLLKNNITVYSAHTNLDKCEGGICQTLAKLLDGKNITSDTIGVQFEIETEKLADFAKRLATILNDRTVKVAGDKDMTVKKVYLISGGGADSFQLNHAREVADVFVTGDIKHHIYIDAEICNFPIVEFSHYNSEIIVTDLLFDMLKKEFPKLKLIKANQECPFRTLEEL
ncbi:MAG: Nif3-like dinuclear metal center hexameric protein [Clostridia bacterium]